MNLANTIKVMQLKQLQEAEEAAKYPHDMFDPETGEKEVANSEAEHKALAAKGYTHEKPEAKDEKDLDESFEETMVDLEEARIKASDYEAASEKSKFGGHRPTVVHKTKGTTLWLGAVGFKTPKAAKAAADAYLTGYAIGSEKGAKRMLDAHIKNNKKNLIDPSILDEAVALDEGKMKEFHDYMQKGKSPEFIAKKMGLDLKTVKQLMDHLSESVDVSEAKKWKLTSMSQDEAIKEFGKKNVRLGRKNGLGRSTVEVYVESVDEARQLKDPKTEVLVVKNGKVEVINKKDLKKFMAKGYELAESVDEARRLSSKEEQAVLKLMSSTKTAQEAAKKVEKEMKIPYKEALEIVRKVMKQYESVEEATDLEEAYQQFTDKTPNWGEDQALTFGRKKGYKEVAVMSDNNSKHPMVLFALDSGDKKYIKGSNVKSGETVFRYATKISIAGDIFPLVKVNIAKGIYYNLTQESSEGTIEDAKFENKGVKLKFFRSLEGAIKESVELDEDYFIVQYYDKKGKADTTKFSKFDDASKAKKYLDRANKTSKEGEYKMLKVKGKMEGLEEAFANFAVPIPKQTLNGKTIGGGKTPIVVKARSAREAITKAAKQLGVDFKFLKTGKVVKEELEEANVFGTRANYGSSDALLAAVNAVVSGQAATVEVSTDDTNAIVEQGVEVVNETKEASTDDEPAADDKKDKKEKKDKTKVEVDVEPNLDEAEQSAKQKKYQAFFQKALKKFGAKSPAELEGDNEKKFYAYVDANWKSEDETE